MTDETVNRSHETCHGMDNDNQATQRSVVYLPSCLQGHLSCTMRAQFAARTYNLCATYVHILYSSVCASAARHENGLSRLTVGRVCGGQHPSAYPNLSHYPGMPHARPCTEHDDHDEQNAPSRFIIFITVRYPCTHRYGRPSWSVSRLRFIIGGWTPAFIVSDERWWVPSCTQCSSAVLVSQPQINAPSAALCTVSSRISPQSRINLLDRLHAVSP
jgi:hypothetical protein